MWKPKGLSDESIKPPVLSSNSLAPALNYIKTKSQVKINGSCLKEEIVTFIHKMVVNIYIVYEICGEVFKVMILRLKFFWLELLSWQEIPIRRSNTDPHPDCG